MQARQPLLVAVMGETASGKTALAENIADRFHAQLINADTFQSYRGMNVGTAKSVRKAEYELIDIKDPDEPFGVGEWVQLAAHVLKTIYAQGRSAVVVGGSGLNIRALFEGYSEMTGMPDPTLREQLNSRLQTEGLSALVNELTNVYPERAASVDLKNPVRVVRALEKAKSPSETVTFELPAFRKVKFAIRSSVEGINSRIHERAWEMARNGWLEEVATLRAAGYGPNAPGFRAHGYRELWRVLEGELGLEEAVDSIVSQVRHYAKRQRTWLRAEPNLTVLESDAQATPLDQALAHLFVIGEGDIENGKDH